MNNEYRTGNVEFRSSCREHFHFNIHYSVFGIRYSQPPSTVPLEHLPVDRNSQAGFIGEGASGSLDDQRLGDDAGVIGAARLARD